jgi:hypothetical protein
VESKVKISAAVLLALACVSLATAAEARRHHHRHYRACAAARRHNANTGMVAGAVGGGLIGNAADHGRAGGTLLGAGVGAVAGHEIGKNSTRC